MGAADCVADPDAGTSREVPAASPRTLGAVRRRLPTRLLLLAAVLAVAVLLLDPWGLLGPDAQGKAPATDPEISALERLQRELMEDGTQGPRLRGLPGLDARMVGSGIVTGRVVLHARDEGVRPLPGVSVQLLGSTPGATSEDAPHPLRFQDETADDGTFTLPDVPAQVGYVLLVDHAPYRRIVLRGLAVGPDRTTDVGTLTLGAPTALRGEVLDAKGRPVSGAVVEVLPDRSRKKTFDVRRALFELQHQDGALARGTSGGDGHFLVDDLPPGRYLLRVSAAGYATRFRQGVLVSVDENSSAVRIVLDPGAGLEGRVTDESGRGLAGARVIAVALPGRNLQRFDRVEVQTDAAGLYRIDTLVPGMGYGVEAWAEGYAPTSRVFMPLPAGTTKQDWRLQPSGRIEGRVVDEETGAGVADCQVTVLAGPLVGVSPVSTTTAEDGHFALPHVNPGPVLLFSAQAPGYASRDTFDFNAVKGMQVVAGRTLWVEWKVRAGGVVEGRLTSDDGHAVPYASLALVDRDRRRQRWSGEITALADAEGRYRLAGVRAGQYDLQVTAVGFAPPTDPQETRVAMPPSLGTLTKDLVLRSGGVVEGRVVAPDGSAVRGARVSFEPADGKTNPDSLRDLFAVTSANGSFRVLGVPPGVDLHVFAEHDAHVRSADTNVRLNPGQSLHVTLRLREGAKLPGRVVDTRGVAVAEAHVRWGRVDGIAERDLRDSFEADAWLGSRVLRTDQDGRFEIDGLAPGRYLLKVEHDGYAAWYRRDQQIAGEGLQAAVTAELVPTLSISGRVRSKGTGEPVPNAFVYAHERGAGDGQPQDPGHVQAIVSTQTDAQGRYVLDRVPPGVHDVVVWFAEGHVAAAQDWHHPGVRRQDVPAGSRGIDFELDPIPVQPPK